MIRVRVSYVAPGQAMKLPQRHKSINDLLIATMSQLEKDKQKLALDPELDKPHLETFALKIFANADKVDRAGRANENTAKAFYAASIFMDVSDRSPHRAWCCCASCASAHAREQRCSPLCRRLGHTQGCPACA